MQPMTDRLGMMIMMTVVMAVGLGASGCASKLVRIDSDPGLARIYVNDEYVGKTPLYHRFRDTWRPWPLDESDDYMVKAQFNSGYRAEEKFFEEQSAWPSIDYVPDEIEFELRPEQVENGF